MTAQLYQTLNLHYDSDNPESPLFNHSMSTSDLTQIIGSFTSLVKEVNKIINGADSEIAIQVHAFEEGSFGILFEVLQSPEALDVLRSLGIIVTGGGITFGGLMSAIQKLKRRKITEIKYREKEGDYVISVDGENIICSKTEKKLITSETVRKTLDNVFSEPLRDSRADNLSIQVGIHVDDKVLESSALVLTVADVEDFAAPEKVLEEVSVDKDTEVSIRFKSAFAEQAGDWSIDMFGKELKVTILDNNFLSAVNTGTHEISFGKLYKADLRETITTKIGSHRKSKKYSITKVIGQIV